MHSSTINLTFHGIGSPPRALEPGEDAVWISRERFEEILDAVAGHPGVHLTFDDGNASDVEIALATLRERGLTASFFLVAGRVGTPGFVDAEGVRTLAESGMTVGSHGLEHRDWRRASLDELGQELVQSRRLLAELAGRDVDQAACPFGSYDRRVLRGLRSAGYRRVFTSDGGRADATAWLQPRTTITPADGRASAERLLAGEPLREALVRRAKAVVKRWR